MVPQRILCPIDFSETSQLALRFATERALESKAKLYIVHVEHLGHGQPPGTPGYVEELDEHKRLLDEGIPSQPGVEFEQHCLRGKPVDEIRRFAALRNIDLIILGTHGRSGFARAMLGSVAESISRDAPCEVVTVSATTKRDGSSAGPSGEPGI